MSNFDSACVEDPENATSSAFGEVAVPTNEVTGAALRGFQQQQPQNPNQDLMNMQAMQQQLQQ